jgi:cobalt-zinc-cadmium efflux system protein
MTPTASSSFIIFEIAHRDAFIHDLCEGLAARFNIGHATVQIEAEPHLSCALAADDVV